MPKAAHTTHNVILSGAKDLSPRPKHSHSDFYTLLFRQIGLVADRYFDAAVSRRKNRAALLYKMSRFSSGVRYSAF